MTKVAKYYIYFLIFYKKTRVPDGMRGGNRDVIISVFIIHVFGEKETTCRKIPLDKPTTFDIMVLEISEHADFYQGGENHDWQVRRIYR